MVAGTVVGTGADRGVVGLWDGAGRGYRKGTSSQFFWKLNCFYLVIEP